MLLTRYLTLRSMRTRYFRVLLSGFGIVLGVAGVLAISITNQAALDSITRLFADTSGRVSLSIAAAGSDSGFPDGIQSTAASVPGVASVLPLLRAQTILAGEATDGEIGISFFGASAGGLLLHGIDPVTDPAARDYVMAEGQFLSSNGNAYEIVLTETYAEDVEAAVGERIEILTPNGVERLRLVGIMAREGPGMTNNGAFGIIPLHTAQEMFNRQGTLDQLDILAQDTNSAALESLRQNLQVRLGSSYSVTFPSSQGQRMTQMMANYQIGLNFMSGIALFVGAFLIYNAFAMNLVERTREFGMLRTIGMTRRQITGQMLVEALVMGIAGSALGAAAGLALSRGLAVLMGTLLGTDLGEIQLSTGALLVSMALGLFVTLGAAALPSLQAGRVSPMTALRIRGAQQEGWLVRNGWKPGLLLLIMATALLVWNPFAYDPLFILGSLTVFALFTGAALMIPVTVTHWERLNRPLMKVLYGSSGFLGSRNIQRSRVRTTLTVAALMVGVSMIMTTQSLTGSFASDLRTWIDSYIGGDLYVSSSVPLRGDIARRIESVPGVAAVAQIRYLPVEWQVSEKSFENINLMAIEPGSYSRVTSFVFTDSSIDVNAALTRLAAGGAVFVSSVLSEKYNLQPGDRVFIKTRQGLRPFEVAAVVIDFYNQGLVMNASWSDMRRYFRVNDASTYLVKVRDGYQPGAVEQQIDTLYGKRYRLLIETNTAIRGRVLTLMNQAFQMFDLLAIIAVVIGSFGVINTLTMNVIERTREIGMLRATGMTRGQVIRMILAEAGLMGMIGGILGLAYGALLARIILIGMTSMSGYRLDFQMPGSAVLTGIIIALVVSQAAAFLPARRAARTKILEAIQYE
jgi:putative ABC transport system permease protein